MIYRPLGRDLLLAAARDVALTGAGPGAAATDRDTVSQLQHSPGITPRIVSVLLHLGIFFIYSVIKVLKIELFQKPNKDEEIIFMYTVRPPSNQ